MKRALFVVFCVLSLVAVGNITAQDLESDARLSPVAAGAPIELTLRGAGDTDIDLRSLPEIPPVEREREEPADPPFNPVELPGGPTVVPDIPEVPPTRLAPAPAPILTFDGLDRLNWGSGSPPDTNGDAGPNHYIQSVNSSVGIYNKADGSQIAAFTFDTLMSQGTFGNQ